MAKPTRRVRLSLVGDDPEVVRARLRRFRYAIRSAGYQWEDWGAIEENPRGTGHHVHLWQWGDYVPVRLVSRIADAKGMGANVDIRAHRTLKGSGPLYGVKVATAYGMKEAAGAGLERFLELNGGRFGVWSRGYFRGPYRAALRAAMGRVEREGHDPGPWRVVSMDRIYQERLRQGREGEEATYRRLRAVAGGIHA